MAQRLKTDWILFFTIVAMVSFGLVMVYSSSSVVAELKFHSGTYFFIRQLGFAVLSFLLLLYCKRSDYRRWNNPKIAFAAIGVVLLMLVVVYFADAKTHRWFHMGIASIQPSEFAKPALAMFLAYFLSQRIGAINDRYTLLPVAFLISALALMVGIADLGTAIVLIATTIAVLFVAGIDRRYLAVTVLAGATLALVFVAAKPYRLGRVIHFVDPEYKLLSRIDSSGSIERYMKSSLATRDPGYQTRQAKIAVGSGGTTGLGLMQGRQKLLYLPESHTDMIYAVIGEETGFFGCTALLAGFMLILWRGIRLYWNAADDFGRYLALSITAGLVIQALINISVVLDLGPTKGIPLPMISYGGSSLLSSLLLLGMLLSVSEHAS